jgi:drug/metabolite transporter (DMT)-like permease
MTSATQMGANRTGIWLMIAAVAAFAAQDGFARYLAETYNTMMIIMIRYWVFAAFVMYLAMRRPEGMRRAISSRRLGAHFWRSVLLVGEICLIVYGYTQIGLIESHAVFAICPLLIVALSGPVLGERLSWQRWAAVAAGLVGVLIILRPTSGVFAPAALLPLSAAVLFAVYSVLTRLTTRGEPTFPSFFWPGVLGAGLMTGLGAFFWQPVQPQDWPLIAIYSALSVFSHWLLLKCYEVAEASSVQPFAYLQIVFVSIIGIVVYAEVLKTNVLIGAAIIVAAGIYALLHERAKVLVR